MAKGYYVILMNNINKSIGYHSVWADGKRAIKYVHKLNKEYNREGLTYLVKYITDFREQVDWSNRPIIRLPNSVGYMSINL